jgi:hypothetical protein
MLWHQVIRVKASAQLVNYNWLHHSAAGATLHLILLHWRNVNISQVLYLYTLFLKEIVSPDQICLKIISFECKTLKNVNIFLEF